MGTATMSETNDNSVDARINEDVAKLLRCKSHIGQANVNHLMRPYIWKRTNEHIYLIDVLKQYEKLMVAARICVTVSNPADILVVSQKSLASRAIFKFAHYVRATHLVNRWTAGTLTNQLTKQYLEPQLIIIADPMQDIQAIKETKYSNVPVIALCNTDTDLKLVDVAIPCNNHSAHSIGIIFWLLTREILALRGEIERDQPWAVIPDMFFQTEETDDKKANDNKEDFFDEDLDQDHVMEEINHNDADNQ